jgi:thioesterase domain-containing protein
MAAFYVEAIRARQPSGPYFLGGWSLGGVVAFEMARQLRARGESVALLALMDSYAPSSADTQTFDDAELLTAFLLDMCRVRGTDLSAAPLDFAAQLRQLDPPRRVERLLEEARRQGLLPVDADAAHLSRQLETFKANHHAVRNYTPQSYDGHVVLFRAESEEEPAADPSRGWRKYVGNVEVHDVPGDHYSILNQPQVGMLAAGVKSYLDETRAVLV